MRPTFAILDPGWECVGVKSFAVLSVACVVLMTLAGCTDPADPVDAVQDSSSCPGDSCAADTRERADAIGAIDGVVKVDKVSRTYGLDRGSARTAEVTSDAAGKRGLVSVGIAVMRALEEWPEHADGAASVVISPASVGEPVTLLLDGDYVCEEVNRVRKPCGPDNSWLLTGERVSETAP